MRMEMITEHTEIHVKFRINPINLRLGIHFVIFCIFLEATFGDTGSRRYWGHTKTRALSISTLSISNKCSSSSSSTNTNSQTSTTTTTTITKEIRSLSS